MPVIVKSERERLDDSNYKLATHPPPQWATTSPPLQSDPRRQHCHKHQMILYPLEVCPDCFREMLAEAAEKHHTETRFEDLSTEIKDEIAAFWMRNK